MGQACRPLVYGILLELHAGNRWQLWLLEFSGPGIFQAEFAHVQPQSGASWQLIIPRNRSLAEGGISPAGFFSQAQLAVRKGMRQRFFWATVVALLVPGSLDFAGTGSAIDQEEV